MLNILNLSWSTNLLASDSQGFIEAGQIARVRSRQYLIEEVVPKPASNQDTLVRLSCLEDDALGEALEVLWERELDAIVLGAIFGDPIANRGFDNPRLFSAYLHTRRWNCVTSTEPKLFQAPYRAGIEVKAEIHDEVLARLLALNQERHQQEILLGQVAEKKSKPKGEKPKAKKSHKSPSNIPTIPGMEV